MNHLVYERNMNELRQVDPGLATLIQECDGTSYRVIPSGNPSFPNLIYDPAEGNKPSVIFYAHEDPFHFSKTFLNAYALDSARFVVFLGAGLAYPALQWVASHPKAKVILVERDVGCMKRAMETKDLSSLIGNQNVKMVIGCPEDKLYIHLRQAVDPHFFGLKEMKFLLWPASLEIAEAYYERVVKVFSDVATIWMAERGNDPYDTLVAYEHFFLNLRKYIENPGAAHFKGFFMGKPAMIVATGPSLRKNIHLLKEAENSAVIISADSSLRILHSHHIFPHFVTTVERTPGFDKQFRELKDLDKTVFAAVTFAHPSTLDAYRGPLLFFNRLYNFMENMGGLEDCVNLGLSTANMAFNVARHMGCDPIILIGNDLAFGLSGTSHAEGFLYGERQQCYEDVDRFEVPGNIDKTVITNQDWFKCIKQYEKSLEEWGGKLINATEGGAKISGSSVMTLKEALERYCLSSFYPREKIKKRFSEWKRKRSVESLLDPLQKYLDSLDPMIGICRSMLSNLSPLLRDIETSIDPMPHDLEKEIMDSLPHLESALNSMTMTPLINSFGEYFHSEIIPLLMEWQVINDRFRSPIWAGAYRIKLAEDFFSTLGQLCISLREVLISGKAILSEMTSS